MITQNGVIIGIDSQITNGSNSRLACKLVHGGSFAVLASGKYGLPSGGVSHDFLDEAKQILAKQTTSSVQDAAAAIDSRIRPLLIRYLTDVFKVQPFNYLMKYNHPNYSILEFVVVGMDRHGPSAYRFQYFAPTPQEFRSETKSFGPTSGQVRAIPVPADYMLPYEGNFWNITANQWKETVAQIAGKIVYSIHEGEKAHKGISDPITTAFIDGSGFQFLDKGALSKNS